MRFNVEIRGFEPGDDEIEARLRGRIEAAVQGILDRSASDGVVIVTEGGPDGTP